MSDPHGGSPSDRELAGVKEHENSSQEHENTHLKEDENSLLVSHAQSEFENSLDQSASRLLGLNNAPSSSSSSDAPTLSTSASHDKKDSGGSSKTSTTKKSSLFTLFSIRKGILYYGTFLAPLPFSRLGFFEKIYR